MMDLDKCVHWSIVPAMELAKHAMGEVITESTILIFANFGKVLHFRSLILVSPAVTKLAEEYMLGPFLFM